MLHMGGFLIKVYWTIPLTIYYGIKKVTIYSFGGKLISSTTIMTDNQKFSTNTLGDGMYIVELISNNGAVSYHKLVKN